MSEALDAGRRHLDCARTYAIEARDAEDDATASLCARLAQMECDLARTEVLLADTAADWQAALAALDDAAFFALAVAPMPLPVATALIHAARDDTFRELAQTVPGFEVGSYAWPCGWLLSLTNSKPARVSKALGCAVWSWGTHPLLILPAEPQATLVARLRKLHEEISRDA